MNNNLAERVLACVRALHLEESREVTREQCAKGDASARDGKEMESMQWSPIKNVTDKCFVNMKTFYENAV